MERDSVRQAPATLVGRFVHRLVLLGGLLALGARASTSAIPVPQGGVVGPLTWRVEEVGVVTNTVEGKAVDAYRFTLVVRELRGSALTFTRFETSVSDRDTFRGTPHVVTGSWKLAPNGEWRITVPYSVTCPHMPVLCEISRVAAPLWQIRLSGRDDRGQGVDLPITVALPPASMRTTFR